MDTATKVGLDARKTASNKVVQKIVEAMREKIRKNIDKRNVKPKPLSDVNSRKF